MRNLTILAYNVADSATLTVPSTAAGMGAANLKTDIKGEVCRVLANTATITVDWAALTTVNAVVIPASNLGPSSTIRVRAYLDAGGTTLLADTGVKYAAPGTVLQNWDFSQTLNVNSFSDGITAITACYLPETVAVRKIVVNITNPDNTFIDISRLVIGNSQEFTYTADYGASVGILDMTKNSRAASGDIRSEWGPKAPTLEFDLTWVVDVDRPRLRQILGRGIGKFLFVSLLPEHGEPTLERDFSIYGKLTQPAGMSFAQYNLHTAKISIEGF